MIAQKQMSIDLYQVFSQLPTFKVHLYSNLSSKWIVDSHLENSSWRLMWLLINFDLIAPRWICILPYKCRYTYKYKYAHTYKFSPPSSGPRYFPHPILFVFSRIDQVNKQYGLMHICIFVCIYVFHIHIFVSKLTIWLVGKEV